MPQPAKHTVLIIGASGFIGNALYKELLSYFNTFGTYCTQEGNFGDNQVFYRYCTEENAITPILEEVRPSVIISAFTGDFTAQLNAHSEIASYVAAHHNTRLLLLSSVQVFDGTSALPRYENDTPLAESSFGKHKLRIERMLLETIPAQTTILRLPMVLGVNSPVLIQLRQAAKHRASFEVFPNLIVSITTADKIAQQVHYIINRALDGIYHLASDDMIHHEDLFREICEKLGDEEPIFKSVFQRNEDSYLAILPKKNKLPRSYRISVSEVIEDCTLKEEIVTFKQ